MDTGYAAWMLASASMVLLMTPGLAFFYGGMTRSKSVLNMMMMSFGAMGIVGVVYVLWGWSMSFGSQDVGTLFANPFELFGLKDVPATSLVFVGFQATFAVITCALISGAIADRAKFSAWLLFVPIWVTVVYFPLAHMVWGGGFLSGLNESGLASLLFGFADGIANVSPVDYAGGTVVHINAGIAGLVLALLIGCATGVLLGMVGSIPPAIRADHARVMATFHRYALDASPRTRCHGTLSVSRIESSAMKRYSSPPDAYRLRAR